MKGLRLRTTHPLAHLDRESVEEIFAFQLRNLGNMALKGCTCLRQHLFATKQGRKWSFDFAFPAERLAVELNGGIWAKGGRGAHSRPANIERDMEKGNAAVLLGWRVLAFTPDQVRSGHALAFTETVLLKLNRPSGAVVWLADSDPKNPLSFSDPCAGSPEAQLLQQRRKTRRASLRPRARRRS